MIEILAALSASAAAGIRIALPLLMIGILQGEKLWSQVPILSYVYSPILLGLLSSWTVLELVAAKKLLGQRILQLVQLFLSPLVGAIMGLAVASATEMPHWIIGLIGGMLAFILQLVQVGWFYRLRGLPSWAVFVQNTLCVVLVCFALAAPTSGGLIALILLWFAVLSAKYWYRWYWRGKKREGGKE
ncbi:MAG: DUF4126 domain-containing protein [Calothrix sp. MO_167.B12]|nr:DUF4126 domain-containing protein [Calothrix sp. MO_167.B12]